MLTRYICGYSFILLTLGVTIVVLPVSGNAEFSSRLEFDVATLGASSQRSSHTKDVDRHVRDADGVEYLSAFRVILDAKHNSLVLAGVPFGLWLDFDCYPFYDNATQEYIPWPEQVLDDFEKILM
tara:strand:+ start:560 stop:934 length:375 start_codon:yes stop_codon:yes gene_type:complete